MKIIKLNFVDFWSHFDKCNNHFVNLLSKKYKLEISESPDFLIYSGYGAEHLKFNCYRIFYNGENERINWNACDFALSFDYLQDQRHFRLPNWFWYDNPAKLVNSKPEVQKIFESKTGFCNFVVSNPHANKRIAFFQKLSKYKKIDSGGKYLNNIGSPILDKLSFIKKYKFSIAFENSSYPGYTTEKIFEPMLVNSIPIYWGNPEVYKDFNTKSFINYHDFRNETEVIDRIIFLDQNDDAYLNMMKEPWYNDNEVPDCMSEDKLLLFFDKIFSAKGNFIPVAKSGKKYIYQTWLYYKKIDHFLNQKLKYKEHFR